MYRTATYWPPGSWELSSHEGRHNVPVQIQAIFTVDNGLEEVYLLTDVAEGGYLFNGVTSVADPRKVRGARKIDIFLTHPDLRSLKQVRKAILAEVEHATG